MGDIDKDAELAKLEARLREAREALQVIEAATRDSDRAAMMGIHSVARRGLEKSSYFADHYRS